MKIQSPAVHFDFPVLVREQCFAVWRHSTPGLHGMKASGDRDIFSDQVTSLPSPASASGTSPLRYSGLSIRQIPFSKLFRQALLTEFVCNSMLS